jgi:hypothetical protein
MTSLPETVKRGKYTLKLVRDTNSGKPLIRTLYAAVRFMTHVEAQGYITGRKQLGDDQYAVYISTKIQPVSERKVELSKMHGKMLHVGGLNTNPTLNPQCRAAYRAGGCGSATICKSCYSVKGLVEGKTGNPPKATSIQMLNRNTRLLTRGALVNIPKITTKFFRFSAEGDLNNEQHLINFFAIARANPNTHFTLWTKRFHIVAAVLRTHSKPSNFYIIQSSMRVNTPEARRPGYAKTFTVYTPEFLKAHPAIKINCGAKSCMGCQLCYTKNNVTVINELLKGGKKTPGKKP